MEDFARSCYASVVDDDSHQTQYKEAPIQYKVYTVQRDTNCMSVILFRASFLHTNLGEGFAMGWWRTGLAIFGAPVVRLEGVVQGDVRRASRRELIIPGEDFVHLHGIEEKGGS